MKKIIKNLLILFLVSLLLCILIFFLGKDILIKTFIINVLHNNYHLELHIDQLHLSTLDSTLTIKNLSINNPLGFSPNPMIKISNLNIKYHLPSLLKGKIFLPEVEIFIERIHVIRNKNGKINLSIFIPKSTKNEDIPKPKQTRFYVERLKLKLDTLLVKDDSLSVEKELKINLEKEFSDFLNFKEIVKTLLEEAVIPTAIPHLSRLLKNKEMIKHKTKIEKKSRKSRKRNFKVLRKI